MHSISAKRVNTYLAILLITLFGSGAAFIITTVAEDAALQAEVLASSYESFDIEAP